MRWLLVLALLLASCGGGSEGTRVTVFAAASLTKAFTAEAEAYERTHGGAHVALSFAGSQSLVAQMQQGAPADVLATADATTIEAVRSSLRAAPQVFAHNQLAIVTPPGNPKHLTSLADLGRGGLKVVLGAPSVPVGKAAARALAAAGVTVHPVSLEDAVTGVVGKVRLGEADAGIAYVTDLSAAVAGTPVPGTTTDLAIGSLTPDGEGFVAFVLSDEGQQVLRQFGFR
ncbi:MAG TPA: molybdate ABC transporter substrate-binding protein [Mycobacteriales bacterium]|nr:molybdate ABC transporter substrate-binding protein [Mycobacteriales bacterium]